jgi:uridine kinase
VTPTHADVAADVPAPGRPVLVGIDGVDGSGKTTYAAALATELRAAGRDVHVVHEDDFLQPRSVRYRWGRHSPEGFYRDTYDERALRAFVLDPLGPGGDRRVRFRAFDHVADRTSPSEPVLVGPDDVVVVEGMFLHRAALDGVWDLSVFLDVPFAETARRMAARDGSHPDPEHPSMRRYVGGQRLYLAERAPRTRATYVVGHV